MKQLLFSFMEENEEQQKSQESLLKVCNKNNDSNEIDLKPIYDQIENICIQLYKAEKIRERFLENLEHDHEMIVLNELRIKKLEKALNIKINKNSFWTKLKCKLFYRMLI